MNCEGESGLLETDRMSVKRWLSRYPGPNHSQANSNPDQTKQLWLSFRYCKVKPVYTVCANHLELSSSAEKREGSVPAARYGASTSVTVASQAATGEEQSHRRLWIGCESSMGVVGGIKAKQATKGVGRAGTMATCSHRILTKHTQTHTSHTPTLVELVSCSLPFRRFTLIRCGNWIHKPMNRGITNGYFAVQICSTFIIRKKSAKYSHGSPPPGSNSQSSSQISVIDMVHVLEELEKLAVKLGQALSKIVVTCSAKSLSIKRMERQTAAVNSSEWATSSSCRRYDAGMGLSFAKSKNRIVDLERGTEEPGTRPPSRRQSHHPSPKSLNKFDTLIVLITPAIISERTTSSRGYVALRLGINAGAPDSGAN
ncbi:hypothetical protein BGY98DRAFT_1176902 [Russula aff. rugulosa BPL654]|nr:hypothetical protein BGY98DRAFT_1176902 [Russula aff. rugulosa BPL654]